MILIACSTSYINSLRKICQAWATRDMSKQPINFRCVRDRANGGGRHVIYAACGGNSNGDQTTRENPLEGSLFENHTCLLCKQANHCVLIHVCEELRLRPECDKLCGDCVLRGLQTSESNGMQIRPQRNLTPIVTCLLGMTILREIQNIVCTVDAQLCRTKGRWTWSFHFEKTIKMKSIQKPKKATCANKYHFADLLVKVNCNNVCIFYIIGETPMRVGID